MCLNEQILPRYVTGEAFAVPKADNDDWGVASDGETPAEALQKLRRLKQKMWQELVGDFTLRACPRHRLIWECVLGAEKCALWVYYRTRKG